MSSGELRQNWRVLSRWGWLIVLTAVVGAFVGYGVARSATRVYRSTATLLIGPPQNPASPDYNLVLLSESLARTYSELVRTRPMLERAIQELHLSASVDEVAD